MAEENPLPAAETPPTSSAAEAPAPEMPPAATASMAAMPARPDELQASLARERWLRDHFEQEHQIIMALLRLLVAGLGDDSRPMRFWRWLIDDLRSERRIRSEPGQAAAEERLLVQRVLYWLTEQRSGRGGRIPPEYPAPGESSSGGGLSPQ
jgi:hypothetical protein